jgi:drug/metabolite transporter (DMT)-like permease
MVRGDWPRVRRKGKNTSAAFTPLYITLIYDLLSGRKLRWGYLLSAALAVLGAIKAPA